MGACETTLYAESGVILVWVLFIFATAVGIGIGYVTVNFHRNKSDRPRNNDVESSFRNMLQENEEEIEKLQKDLTQEMSQRTNLETRLTNVNREKENAFKRLAEKARQNEILQDELISGNLKITNLEQKLTDVNLEKEDALKRLSALMSSRLRDGNPNVVDLSDSNRPVKIGEQFSELYDNQWTDAYGAVETRYGMDMNEDDVIKLLLDVLQQCFLFCKQRADDDLVAFTQMVGKLTGSFSNKASRLLDDMMQRIKEERKLSAVENIPDYQEALSKVKENLTQLENKQDLLDMEPMKLYLKECLKLCWLMVVQDPPMTLELEPVGDATGEYKAYKHRGNDVVFIVWPALYLEKGGALLAKGVAEYT